jgi:hypothetical protein
MQLLQVVPYSKYMSGTSLRAIILLFSGWLESASSNAPAADRNVRLDFHPNRNPNKAVAGYNAPRHYGQAIRCIIVCLNGAKLT